MCFVEASAITLAYFLGLSPVYFGGRCYNCNCLLPHLSRSSTVLSLLCETVDICCCFMAPSKNF